MHLVQNWFRQEGGRGQKHLSPPQLYTCVVLSVRGVRRRGRDHPVCGSGGGGSGGDSQPAGAQRGEQRGEQQRRGAHQRAALQLQWAPHPGVLLGYVDLSSLFTLHTCCFLWHTSSVSPSYISKHSKKRSHWVFHGRECIDPVDHVLIHPNWNGVWLQDCGKWCLHFGHLPPSSPRHDKWVSFITPVSFLTAFFILSTAVFFLSFLCLVV